MVRCEGAPRAAQHMALRVLLEQSDHRSRGPELGRTHSRRLESGGHALVGEPLPPAQPGRRGEELAQPARESEPVAHEQGAVRGHRERETTHQRREPIAQAPAARLVRVRARA